MSALPRDVPDMVVQTILDSPFGPLTLVGPGVLTGLGTDAQRHRPSRIACRQD